MRFCTRMLLQRTRRILAETQAAIVEAARPKQRGKTRFTAAQDRIGIEWYERQKTNKEKRTA